MTSEPRLTVDLILEDEAGLQIDYLKSDVPARQSLTIHNEGPRPYLLQAWAMSQDSRLSYPNGRTTDAVMTSTRLEPSLSHTGQEIILWEARGHPTPVSVQIGLQVDWRLSHIGSWDVQRREPAFIDCRP